MNIQKLKKIFNTYSKVAKRGRCITRSTRLAASIPPRFSSDAQEQKAAIAEKGCLQVAEDIQKAIFFAGL